MILNINENNKFKFEIQIEGASSNENFKPRLIMHAKNFDLCFNGKISENLCEFNIPKLEKTLLENKVKAEIEIIHENKYFKPWIGTIDIEKPVNFKVNESSVTIKNETKFNFVPKDIVKSDQQYFENKIGKSIKINKNGKIKKAIIESVLEKFENNEFLVKVKLTDGSTQKVRVKK